MLGKEEATKYLNVTKFPYLANLPFPKQATSRRQRKKRNLDAPETDSWFTVSTASIDSTACKDPLDVQKRVVIPEAENEATPSTDRHSTSLSVSSHTDADASSANDGD